MNTLDDSRWSSWAKVGSVCAFIAILGGQSSLAIPAPGGDTRIPMALICAAAMIAVLLGPLTLGIRQMPGLRVMTSTFLAVSCLAMVLLLSSLWSDAGPATWTQVLWIAVMLGELLIVSASVQLSPVVAVDTFMRLSAVAGLIFAVGGLLSGGDAGRLAAFGGGPNVFGRITGIGIVAMVYWFLRGFRGGLLALALAPVLVAATLLSGSRGAMLGTAFGIAVILCALPPAQWRRLFLGGLVVAPALVYFYLNLGRGIEAVVNQRIVRLTLEEGYTSGRSGLWASAYRLIEQNPLAGVGVGTFIDREGFYVHNLVLQVGVDAGLIGLFALAIVLVVIARSIWGRRIRLVTVIGPLAAGAAILVASMFSGDHFDSRFLWAYMILAGGAAAGARSHTDAVASTSAGPLGVGRVGAITADDRLS